MLFEDFYEMFLDYRAGFLSETSLQTEKYRLNKHMLEFFRGIKMQDIDSLLIERWYIQLLKKNFSTMHNKHIIYSARLLFVYYARLYKVANVFPPEIKSPKKVSEKKIRNVLTFVEFMKVIKIINKIQKDEKKRELDILLFVLLFFTGARIREILGLSLEQIDLKNRLLKIDRQVDNRKSCIKYILKTDASYRLIPMANIVCNVLNKYITKCDDHYLFFDAVAYDYTSITERKKEYFDKCNVEACEFRHFRTSFITNAINLGSSISAVSKIVGHSEIIVTMNSYYKSNNQQKMKVVEMLDEQLKKENRHFYEKLNKIIKDKK